MPRYVVVEAPRALPDEPERRRPLSEQVAQCLAEWNVDSDCSSDSDEFCGWRVGSRAQALLPPAPLSQSSAHAKKAVRAAVHASRAKEGAQPSDIALAARVAALRAVAATSGPMATQQQSSASGKRTSWRRAGPS
jgi:hypothetical protein